MSHLDLNGLQRYASKQKEWADARFASINDLNWQKTEKAGAVTLYPTPDTVLEPVVDFSFTETPPAEGDKALDNPSTITGVSTVKVTRCGKNLANSDDIYVLPNRGITAERNADGSVHVSGTTSGSGYVYLGNDTTTTTHIGGVEPGKTYTVSLTTTYADCILQFFSVLCGNSVSSPVLTVQPNSTGTVTIAALADRSFVRIAIPSGNATNFDAYVQIEEGSTATTFESYSGTDYTINLGSTYYGGSLDVSTGLMTVTWFGHVFDGTETTSTFTALETNGRLLFPLDGLVAADNTNQTCSHLPLLMNYANDSAHFYVNYSAGNSGCMLFAPYLTQESFLAWLASEYANNTPVTVCCKLATPTTVQLTPQQILSLTQTNLQTPRLNTVYTDADAVQVGYAKSQIVTNQELTQAILELNS